MRIPTTATNLLLLFISQWVLASARELSVPHRDLKKDDPTPSPTLSPTPKPKNTSKNDRDKDEEEDDEEEEETNAPIPSPTRMPVPIPSPTRMPVSIPSPTRMPVPSASFTAAVPAATPRPTPEPTKEPTVEPTAEPTIEPTMEPTEEPTMEPTGEPTMEPTGEPTESPSARPTASPSFAPSAIPSLQPSAVPSSVPSLSRHEIVLNAFNVLLTSDQGPVNIAELERSMETYILETMAFDNLLRVELDVVEGDSVTDSLGTFISTSVRFEGIATFTSQLPPSEEIRKEQSLVLNSKATMQGELHENPALAHATVQDVSFERIESTRPFDELDAQNQKDTKVFGFGMISIVSAIGVVALLSVLGGILVVRLRSAEKKYSKQSKLKHMPAFDDSDSDSSIQPPTKNKPKKKKNDVGHTGCASLVSGQVSLGNDSRLYSLPESLDDIVIRPMFSDDEDDAYLTMDEELQDPYECL